MGALSATEFAIIRSLLVEQYGADSPFLGQLASARVEKRRLTGVGIFIDLSIDRTDNRVDDINTEITNSGKTLLDAPRDLVGFTLFIRGGYLSFLEGYTFGNVTWPDEPMEQWLALAKSKQAAPRAG